MVRPFYETLRAAALVVLRTYGVLLAHVRRLFAIRPTFHLAGRVTEQNYADPGQAEPVSQIQAQELLARIVALEQQVASLKEQLALAQGGLPGQPI